MLGEAAKKREDAKIYFKSYQNAIEAIGQASKELTHITGTWNFNKIIRTTSTLWIIQTRSSLKWIGPQLLTLAIAAKKYNIGFTIDAEEADRLELSLEIIEKFSVIQRSTAGKDSGLLYNLIKNARHTSIDWLADLSKRYKRRLMYV